MDNYYELTFPTYFSREFTLNVENVCFSLITQETNHIWYSSPSHTIKHFHSCYELFFCEKGKMYIDLDDGKVVLNENEFIIISPKVSHSTISNRENSSVIQLYFNISSNGLKGDLNLYDIVFNLLSEKYMVVSDAAIIGPSVKMIETAREEVDILSMSFSVLYFLTKLVELTGNLPQVMNVLYSDNSNIRLHRILSFIHSRFHEEITLGQIADVLHLSTRQVCRVIKENFGCTFKELVIDIRMKKAGELLLTSNYKISDITELVGYSSLRGFYTAFKRHYGCLPNEYKKQFKHK